MRYPPLFGMAVAALIATTIDQVESIEAIREGSNLFSSATP